MKKRDAIKQIQQVIDQGNCSGCGVCAALATNLTMENNQAGYARPVPENGILGTSGLDSQTFSQFCPGVKLSAPRSDFNFDPVFGRFVSIWEGHALDDEVRREGSSGGVITALTAWLLENGTAESAVAAVQSPYSTNSVPVRITTREEAEAASGSRYAPVAVGSKYRFNEQASSEVRIGKPCEIAAANAVPIPRGSQCAPPISISFFCAGTPSQNATDKFVADSNLKPEGTRVRYRGNGWPGKLTAVNGEGVSEMSYEKAWSTILGPTIQWRCKICPDGTGEHADISVGDYWETDLRGYPIFDNLDGTSVILARTLRGHELLEAARSAGIVALRSIDRKRLYAAQPSQVFRRRSLAGRILGARLAGLRTPSFRGFNYFRLAARNPSTFVHAVLGTFIRVKRGNTGSM